MHFGVEEVNYEPGKTKTVFLIFTLFFFSLDPMKKPSKVYIHVLAAGVVAQAILGAGEPVIEKENAMISSTAAYGVCNLSSIYDKAGRYEYSLPKAVLEKFLSGEAFDNPEAYSKEERCALEEDIREIFQKILSTKPIKEHLAVITAGAPGAGKTVALHQDLEKKRGFGRNYAYICPDDVCLKNQSRTYIADIKKGNGSKEARLASYNKWRPGSNAAAHLILAHLIREKYAFYFGTTSSSPLTGKFFEFLKKQGYRIRLIHVTAPDNVRWGSIRERDKGFIQTTEQDVKEKGLLLPQRIQDTFLTYADEIEFYYRDGVEKDAKLAATWIRNRDCSEALGTLQIVDPFQYEQIKTIHNTAVTILDRPDLKWELTVEKNSKTDE